MGAVADGDEEISLARHFEDAVALAVEDLLEDADGLAELPAAESSSAGEGPRGRRGSRSGKTGPVWARIGAGRKKRAERRRVRSRDRVVSIAFLPVTGTCPPVVPRAANIGSIVIVGPDIPLCTTDLYVPRTGLGSYSGLKPGCRPDDGGGHVPPCMLILDVDAVLHAERG